MVMLTESWHFLVHFYIYTNMLLEFYLTEKSETVVGLFYLKWVMNRLELLLVAI